MKKIGFIIVIAFLLANCTNSNKQKNGEETTSKVEEVQKVLNNGRNAVGNVKSVSVFMRMSGASFMPELVNDPYKAHDYKATQYLAAANFGIYTTDVIYQSAYKRTEGAILGYGAAKELAYFIGIGEVFDDLFLKRIEEGLNTQDSVVFKLNETISKSNNVLNDNKKAKLFTAIKIGSDIEKLWIVNNIIFNYPEDLPEEPKLLVLRQSLEVLNELKNNFIVTSELFDQYDPDTEKGKEVFVLMNELKDIYSTVELQKNIQTMEPDRIFKNEKLLSAFDKIKKVRKILILEE